MFNIDVSIQSLLPKFKSCLGSRLSALEPKTFLFFCLVDLDFLYLLVIKKQLSMCSRLDDQVKYHFFNTTWKDNFMQNPTMLVFRITRSHGSYSKDIDVKFHISNGHGFQKKVAQFL